MNKLLNNLLGMYKQAKLNKKAEEDVEDVEDIEKWFSVKLNNDQAKEFTKLLTENNIKNKSKKEGEEIRVSFFLLPSSIGVAQGLLSATLSKFPDKESSTKQKVSKKAGWSEKEKEQVGAIEENNDKYKIYQNNAGEVVVTNHKLNDKYALMDSANNIEDIEDKIATDWEGHASIILWDIALKGDVWFMEEAEIGETGIVDMSSEYAEENKTSVTNKKAENEDLIAIGWGLYTYENNIKANAEDDGRTIDRDFWNKINNDIDKVESWFLKEGYKQFFTKVRDEGHGKDSELGGTAFVTEEQLKNFIDRADGMNGAYTLTETSGALEFPIDYDETIFFELVIFVDEKILDDLNIESKKNIKNKKQSSKEKAMRKKAFRKLCLKRAFHKTAGEFEEMMKLKSTDPKLISYLAKEFGVEESTVSQYTDVSENAEELYNILEQQANKYGYEWDKFEYDEYGDRIDEDDFRGDPDDLDKAVEYLKNNIDKSMFKFEYVGQYEDNYLTFSVNEKLIPIEKPIIYITNDTKNYDISFFVQSQKSKEEDKAEGIESNDHLTILLRRTSDEILNEIVNYVNVELPKKIEEQNKKQSSKAKAVFKKAEDKEFYKEYKEEIKSRLDKDNRIDSYVFSDDSRKVNIRIKDSKMGYRKTGFISLVQALDIEYLMDKVNADGKEMKTASKTKAVRKQAKYEETVQGDEKVKDSAKSFGYDIKFAGHYGKWIYYYLIDEKGNIIRDDKEYQKVYDEMKKRIDDDIDIDNYAFAKGLIEEVDGELMRVPTIVISEYTLLSNHKDREENTGLEEFKRDFNLSSSTKKQAGIDPNVSAEDILKLNFDMPIDKADKVKEQFNEKGIKYQSRKGKYTVEFSVDIEASKVDLVYEIIRNIKKSSSTKKQATIKHENGVYNVYSESGKCLGKGYKTKEEAEKRLKQVEYFKNKKAVTGTDYWGPKEIPDEEEEGTFIIRYYGGPGHIDYLRKSRNGKYHWVEQTHFDYINDKPFETTDYELAKKLVEQYGGEIEKKESKQVNNKRTSLKVEYFKNKKANKEDTYEEWGVYGDDIEEWSESYTKAKMFFEKNKKDVKQFVHKVYDISGDEAEEIEVEVLYDRDRNINKVNYKTQPNKRTSLKQVVISKMAKIKK